VVARARESAAYGARDVTDKVLANLQPRYVRFDLTSDGDGPKVDPVVNFTKGGEKDAVAEGAYLIVAHDRLRPSGGIGGGPQGALNCNVFRIGNHIAGDAWELSPDGEFEQQNVFGSMIQGLTDAEGYVIGRTKVGGKYEGVAQDVAVYTMLIPMQ